MSPDATNAIKLQSLLTLVVENLHATTKMKQPAPRLLDYCRDFGKAIRESIKLITHWSFKYFTHRKSYYTVPELAMDLSAIAKLNPISVVSMDMTNISKMREWASEHGQCVRPLTLSPLGPLGSKQQNFQLAHYPSVSL